MTFNYSPLKVSISIMLAMILYSCAREEVYMGDDLDITTSRDTIMFDTVFTEVGSATRSFKIYNNQNRAVAVDIKLQGGTNSFYRINADGLVGPEVNGVTVQADDSIYVFVEVFIDPDQPLSISPFVVEDQVVISGGQDQEIVQLESFGQNANYVFGKRDITAIEDICNNLSQVIWDDPKPYVIYGIMGIDGCDLIMNAGTRVYVHGGIVLQDSLTYNPGRIITINGGSIQANGTLAEPITIEGDRLEPEFADVAGQWFGIVLTNASVDNSFSYTTIKNGIYGILADSSSHVSMSHCQLLNSSSLGLLGSHASADISNSLIYSAGSYGVYWRYGGNYNMNYSTVVSYGVQAEAIRMENYLCTDPLCLGEILTNPLTATISNSILAGSSRDEILIDEFEGSDAITVDYTINNSIIRIDEFLDSRPDFFENCNNCINYNGSDILFLDINENNFQLDSLSIAELKGIPDINVTDDLLGRMRSSTPDIGCYESQFKL